MERAVQTFKNAIKKSEKRESLECRLAKFQFSYRTTPHTTTGKTPAELLMGRCLGTRLHKLLPEGEVRRRVLEKRNMQKIAHDKNVKQCNFLVGDSVIVRNFGSGSKWIAGKVSSSRGPVSLQVLLNDGRTVHRHFDHVRSASSFLVNPGKPRHQSQSRKIHGLTLGLQAWKKQYLANKELMFNRMKNQNHHLTLKSKQRNQGQPSFQSLGVQQESDIPLLDCKYGILTTVWLS